MIAQALIALSLTIPGTSARSVDRIEVNTVINDELSFRQVILWRWSWQLKRYHVAEWHMLRDQDLVRLPGDVYRFRDCNGITRRVRCKSVIYTEGIDSELANRKVLSQENREPYF